MKYNGNIQKILKRTLTCVMVLAVFLMLGFVNKSQKELLCNGIIIRIDQNTDHEFVDEMEVRGLLMSKGTLRGKPLGSINTSMLEKIILSNPYVKKVEVYSSIDGNLHADVTQRNPVVRVITMHDEQFYIDENGGFMPVSTHYTPPVPVASGYIFNSFAEMKVRDHAVVPDTAIVNPAVTMMGQIFAISNYIKADTFWNANTEQIYVNEQQEIELIPRAGNHRIILGDTSMLLDKFNRLMIFYNEGLSKTGWNQYSTINLKFRDQVVCTKLKQ